VTGRLAPPRDPEALAEALSDLLRDEERRRTFGAAGRRRFLERFTTDHMVAETLAVLGEVA
jgi:glycosyltransferase involved in cell wall biosynthesis